MEFISHRKNRRCQPGEQKQDRHLCLQTSTAVQPPPQQHRQDRVFSDVSELTQRQLNRRDGRSGDLRVQPAQERNKKTRGLFGGKRISRACENQTEPDQNRQPIFQKRFHPKVGSQRSDDSVFCISQSAIYNPPSTMTSPLTFEPIFMERMWGGRRLDSEFGKKLPLNTRIGESWEIVDRLEAQSVVANRPLKEKTLHELWTQNRQDIFGDVLETPRFLLLIKLLDAQERLSLQVHPPEEVAGKLGGEPKTEFWYVAAADPGAELSLGFRELITREQFKRALDKGTLEDCVQKIRVRAGEIG